jgi:hypothetical protein
MTGGGKTHARDSAAKRAAAWGNLRKAHEAQRSYPLCNAKRRDGGRCENLGTGTGGRCRLHGGATPTGKDWHKVQLTNPGKSPEKLERKLRDVARRRAKQAARVAAMTPEQRARYDAWHAARRPGGPEVRRAAREAREFRDMLAERASAAPVETPEARAIREAIEALERRTAALKQPPGNGPVIEDPFS